jgi:hypothetical protein
MKARWVIGVLGSVGPTLGLALTLIALAPPPALAAPAIAVNCSTDNLQTQINAAAPGSTLLVSGTCKGQFTISRNLVLQGQGTSPTLDGDFAGTVLTIQSGATVTVVGLIITHGGPLSIYSNSGGTLTLQNSTVAGNSGSASFGTIYNGPGSTLTLQDSTVTGNSGIGIRNDGGTLTLEDSAVAGNNSPTDGGGINNNNNGTVTLRRSIVTGNTAHHGGGIASSNGTLSLQDSTVAGNSSPISGGGIFMGGSGIVTLRKSFVIGNNAGNGSDPSVSGGGIFNNGGTLTLQDSTVTGNTAGGGVATAGRGGGIYNGVANFIPGALNLQNSTVTGNSAGVGAGIYNEPGSTLTLKNSSVELNAPDQCVGPPCP